MSLRLIPEIFNAIDVIMFVRKQLAMIDAVVLELCHIQRIISAPAIRINNAIKGDFTGNDGH